MRQRMSMAVLVATALIVVATGCAGPTAGSVPSPGVTAAPAGDLSGTWRGSYGWIGAYFVVNEGDCVLRIEEDGTFTEAVTPARGASNLAKASTWSGTVVTRGGRVTLRTSQGPWITLTRSGRTLYGVARDPIVEATIMIRFERDANGG
jgi:hypothetical protein